MNSQHLRLKWHFEKLDKYGPRKLKSTCGGYSGSFLSFSKRSVCVSPLFVCESYLVLSVPHFAKKVIPKASDKAKHKGECGQHYRLCVPSCPRSITGGDTHSLCVVCLGAKHAESALKGAGIASVCRCVHFAPGRLSSRREPSPAFLAVPALLPPRWSNGCIRGDHRWIWWREWRWASPFLLPHPPDPAPALWDRKPALQFLPPGRGLNAPPVFLRGG